MSIILSIIISSCFGEGGEDGGIGDVEGAGGGEAELAVEGDFIGGGEAEAFFEVAGGGEAFGGADFGAGEAGGAAFGDGFAELGDAELIHAELEEHLGAEVFDAALNFGGAEEAAGIGTGRLFVFAGIGFEIGGGGVSEGFTGIELGEPLVLGIVERGIGGVVAFIQIKEGFVFHTSSFTRLRQGVARSKKVKNKGCHPPVE